MRRTWIGWVVGVALLGAGAARAAPARLGQIPRSRVDALLQGLLARRGSLADRTSTVSARLMGTRYVRDPLGEGRRGRWDRGPLIDLRRVDCLTFVEQVLALAQRPSLDAATSLLQRYRYQGGRIAYDRRRHFMELQWLPGLIGEGLLRDITGEVAGKELRVFRRRVTRRSYRGRFRKWVRRLGARLPVGRIALPYLLARRAPRVAARIPEGALLSLVLRTPRTWPVAVSHVGLVARRGKHLVFRHAMHVAGRVIEERLTRYLRRHARKRTTLGFNITLPLPAGGVTLPPPK